MKKRELNLTNVVDFVSSILDQTDAEFTQAFSLTKNISYKSENGTFNPVTETDLRIEEMIKEALSKEFPKFGFLGEEGTNELGKEFNWIIDPVDGTTNFSSGIPLCGTAIVLYQHQTPLFVAHSFPLLRERVFGYDQSITLNGTPITDNPVKKRVRLEYESSGSNRERAVLVKKLAELGYPVERYGTAAYATTLAATGRIDVVVMENLATWDVAAAFAFAACSDQLACIKLSDGELLQDPNNSVDVAYQHTVVFGQKDEAQKVAALLQQE